MSETVENRYRGKRIAVLQAGSAKGEFGGAERFYAGLIAALAEKGCKAEAVSIPADEATFDHILANYAACRSLDLSRFDLVISTKAPTYAAQHPNHLLYLVHTIRVFYDMFHNAFPNATAGHREQRSRVHALDGDSIGGITRRFAIGHEVANRLLDWHGLDCEVLHPPLATSGFSSGSYGDYFFLPGRLHRWKRAKLAIQAVMASALPMRLVVAGVGEEEDELKSLARHDSRIQFLGRISDGKLIELYSGCLAVPFVPLREDYGYVTLEAFASAKAVITCNDSGETCQFVRDGVTGLVCDPTPGSIRLAMEKLFGNRDVAEALGGQAKQATAHLSWASTAERLLEAGFPVPGRSGTSPGTKASTRVSILDMQPIDPPIGGGRLRLLGLYHALGTDIDAHYVGTYDWPGEGFRRHMLSPTLEEIDVPLSAAHHAAAGMLSAEAGGKTVIDLAFSKQVTLSPDYLRHAREAVERADVIIFSHPWVFLPMAPYLRPSQLVVYESHNMEGFLRGQLLDERNPAEAELLRDVVRAEFAAGSRSDLVLACSVEDLNLFVRIYGWPADKIRVVPNGAMASAITPNSYDERNQAKVKLGLALDRKAAIFIGSAYRPNIEAADFIIGELAASVPECDFILAGGVGSGTQSKLPGNVVVTGQISDSEKLSWLRAADIAVNPMFSGSGTNIKMFDFMAAGLPVVTTRIGARGISLAGRDPLVIVDFPYRDFSIAIQNLISDDSDRNRRSIDARLCIEEDYSWEAISARLGQLLQRRVRQHWRARPHFSVVIPTLDRHDKLDALIECLQAQHEGDFEVVIVDQTSEPWHGRYSNFGFQLTYIRERIRGAARARNAGAFFAKGHILAFTDDDCLPKHDWLSCARPYFLDSAVQAVEGLVESDHLLDPNFRLVTNLGFEGFGFMTANLLVRADTFQKIGGFDLSFDRPSFREDTDLGWRIQELGNTPFANDVRVVHPALSRNVERESHLERAKFFEKDALLFSKHPEKYSALFQMEGHWNKTEGFWDSFSAGARKYKVDISAFDGFRQHSYVELCRLKAMAG